MYVENIDEHYNVCIENDRFFLGQPLDTKSINIMAVPSNKENPMSTRAFKDNQLMEKKKQQGEIVFNVLGTKYDVVKNVGRDSFNWVLTTDPKKEWDVAWIDYITDYSLYFRLKPFQKVSFFPGIKCLARKDQLGRNLMRLKKLFPNEYDFFPETFILPFDYEEFRSHVIKGKQQTVYIVKPQASCQGKGIFLTQTLGNIDRSMDYVAQKYLTDPLLIDGLKFDMRLYVLVTNCDPLKIYLHEDGLVRFATEPYQSPKGNNLGDVCMHLTNYAINKNNPNFVFNESATDDNVGHKRSIKALMSMLEEEGHDVDSLWNDIKKIIIKTFCSGQSILANTYKSYNNRASPISNCFQILGFDIMLDQKMKPWLIEVNQSPSWTTDTPLDTTIKENVIRDAIKILNISAKDRINFKRKNKEEIEARSLTGKTTKPTEEQLKAEFLKAQEEQDRWESTHDTGGYEMIFPLKPDSKHEEDYNAYLDAAKETPALKETTTQWKVQIAALELAHEKFNQVLSPKVSKSPTPIVTAKARKQDAPPLKERKVEKVDSRRNSKQPIQKTPERPNSNKRMIVADHKEQRDVVVRDIKIENIEEENKSRDITPIPVSNNNSHHNSHNNHNNHNSHNSHNSHNTPVTKKKGSVPNKSSEIIKKIQRIEKALIKIEDLDDLFEKNIHISSRDLLSKTSRKHADVSDKSPVKYQHPHQSGSFQRQLAASILERLTAGKKQRSKGSMHIPSDSSSSALRFDLSTTNKLAIDRGLDQKTVYYPKRFIQQMTNPEVRKTLTSAQTLRSSENISVALDRMGDHERDMLSPNKTSKSRKATPMVVQSQSYGKVMFGRERSNPPHAETFFVMPKRAENSYSNLSKTRGSFNSSYEKASGRMGNFNEVEGLISVSNMIKSSVSNYAISRRAEK